VPGSVPPTPNGVRAAIPAEEYWRDNRGLPVGGNRGTAADPTSNNDDTIGGQVENNDDNGPRRLRPQIDTSPARGADVAANIAKSARPALTMAEYEAFKERER
jgi:hypothetical protein